MNTCYFRLYVTLSLSLFSGFGVLYYGGMFQPSTLQHVELNIVESLDCNGIYSSYGGITDAMMCAGEEGKDGCQGDSGKFTV